MPGMNEPRTYWRLCTTCRKELPFSQMYWVCSVSTCNRKKMPLTFCSVACWDAHLPTMRHRDAWAEERRAPSHEKWEAEQAVSTPAQPARRRVVERSTGAAPVGTAPTQSQAMDFGAGQELQLTDEDLPREVLIIASRLKQYISARSGMKTSDTVLQVLSDMVRERCDAAIRQAGRSERKTVLDRDF